MDKPAQQAGATNTNSEYSSRSLGSSSLQKRTELVVQRSLPLVSESALLALPVPTHLAVREQAESALS